MVFDGFLRLKYGLSTGQRKSNFSKTYGKTSFRIALGDSTGFLRVGTGFLRVGTAFLRVPNNIQLSGHHEHDESCNDWSLGQFPHFLALYCNAVDIIDGTI